MTSNEDSHKSAKNLLRELENSTRLESIRMIGGTEVAPDSAPIEEFRNASYKNGLGGVEAATS